MIRSAASQIAISAPSTDLPYEVNTYNTDGDTVPHIGLFGSVLAARASIAEHAGKPLDINTYDAFAPPSMTVL